MILENTVRLMFLKVNGLQLTRKVYSDGAVDLRSASEVIEKSVDWVNLAHHHLNLSRVGVVFLLFLIERAQVTADFHDLKNVNILFFLG